MTVERRTTWPQAAELQQAADTKRATGTPEDAALADWLEATANALAWLAPFREHEPGYLLWQTATAYAQVVRTANPNGGERPVSAAVEELATAVERVRTGRLRHDRALAIALDGWLTDITRHWTDTPSVERHHAQAVARALNGSETR